jgi:hypothetical protein
MEEEINYREFLRFALQHFNIAVLSETEKFIELEKDYRIEWENDHLYKLIYKGQVISPFNDIERLCYFIQEDIKLNS